ncbi:hypothetical protein D9M68_850410 [compost metagenome]
MVFLFGQVLQRGPGRFLQVLQASVAECGTDHGDWSGEAQDIQAIRQGFSGVLDAVQLVVGFGHHHCGTAGTHRAPPMERLGLLQQRCT